MLRVAAREQVDFSQANAAPEEPKTYGTEKLSINRGGAATAARTRSPVRYDEGACPNSLPRK
jgi:hypothetical protein